MEAWIHKILESGQAGIGVLIAVFLLGMIGVLTCGCNYSIFAIIAGYSGSSTATEKTKTVIWGGFAFMAGAILSMAIIGGLFGFAGNVINNSFGNYWKIAAGLICVVFGLYSMDLLPFRVPSINLDKDNRKPGFISAIIFGLTVGGLSTAFNSCCNPLFPIVLAASFVKGSMIWGILMLTVFALGYSLPLAVAMVGVKLGLNTMSKTLSRVGTVVKYAGGILLVIIGFYFLVTI